MQLVGQGHAVKKYIIIQTHIIVSFPQPQHNYSPLPAFVTWEGGEEEGGGVGGGAAEEG